MPVVNNVGDLYSFFDFYPVIATWHFALREMIDDLEKMLAFEWTMVR